jgi:ribosomal protein L1
MSEVYHVVVHFNNKKFDLYFDDQETAENIAMFLEFMAENAKKEIKVEYIVQEVYSKETTIEKLKIGLMFGEFLGPN